MTFVLGLIIGLIVGWIVEWVIDFIFWRQDDGAFQNRLREAETRVQQLEAELTDATDLSTQADTRVRELEAQLAGSTNSIAETEARIQQLETELDKKNESLAEVEARVQQLEADLAEAKRTKADTETQLQQLKSKLNETPQSLAQPAVNRHDHLERIHGIGPVFAKRLNEAGIYTYTDLVAKTPEELHQIIKPQDWQKINPERWISEARTHVE